MKRTMSAGFTLVEIMITVAIIGLLASIAIPSFVKARTRSQTNVCVNNLRQIASAKDQWAIEIGVSSGTPAMSTLVGDYIKRTPECPVNGTYSIGDVNDDPTCGSYNATSHNATF